MKIKHFIYGVLFTLILLFFINATGDTNPINDLVGKTVNIKTMAGNSLKVKLKGVYQNGVVIKISSKTTSFYPYSNIQWIDLD